MRICYITAGAVGAYCGACNRDATLARALAALGHDVMLVPLYSPLLVDGPDPSIPRVFYGGINTWLQQKSALFRRLPDRLSGFLDSPRLLNAASRLAMSARPEELGEMTVSVLSGRHGRQARELHKLVSFLASAPQFDIVNLTNTMLSGLAADLCEGLGAPVVCTLQGEESFLARLAEPCRSRAEELIRANAQNVAMFLAPSEDYADEMTTFLGVGRERIAVAPPGIDVSLYSVCRPRVKEPFRVGFLSRLEPHKGLDILAEAFCIMENRRRSGAILSVAGADTGCAHRVISAAKRTLVGNGLGGKFEYYGTFDAEGKRGFLARCSVFCLPSRIAERRAIACLEAMAAGVPILAPDSGIMPGLIEKTGGGVVVSSLEPAAWADALENMRDNPGEADALGMRAAEGVSRHFSAQTMAAKVLEAYNKVINREISPL